MVNKMRDKTPTKERKIEDMTDGKDESSYEPFQTKDDDLIMKCCKHIAGSLEYLFHKEKNDKASGASENIPGNSESKENRILRTAPGRRRNSVGSLFQFVTNKAAKRTQEETNEGVFGKDVSVSEAMTKFQFRTSHGPQISSGAQLENDPDRLFAVTKRKRILDYTANLKNGKCNQNENEKISLLPLIHTLNVHMSHVGFTVHDLWA